MQSYVFRGLLKLWTIILLHMLAHALFSVIYQTFVAERRTLHWRENDLLHKNIIARTSFLIHSTDWSLTNFSMRFPHKFLNSLTLNLTEMLIWKENNSVKYGDFPDQSQSFRFFGSLARTKTNYVIIGLVCRRLRCEPFIPAVCVLCKRHSYKWFLLPLM